MTAILTTLGWIAVVIDVIAAASLASSRGGDAATRGLGPGIGAALGTLAAVAALLLWLGRSLESTVALALGATLAALPIAAGMTLAFSRNPLALIYPSMRAARAPRGPSAQYAFPDAVTRETALALVKQDYAKVDALLRASPPPDLRARDERGMALLGIATANAIMDGGTLADLEGLRLLVAAGSRPRGDDRGPDFRLIEMLIGERNDRQLKALELLLDAGLDPNTRLHGGRPVLFHEDLAPAAARLLLARGANPAAIDGGGGHHDWSAVTYQADLRRWATALVLLEGGVARDNGAPPGAVLERVLKYFESRATDSERNDPAYRAFMAAVEH